MEAAIHCYESVAGEDISDTSLRAVIMQGAPEPLRTQLQVSASALQTFAQTKEAVRPYSMAQRNFTYEAVDASAAMEVDVVSGYDKGKGKG